jgi:hypothetical protein
MWDIILQAFALRNKEPGEGSAAGALKPDEEPFRSLILRYGGEDALRRIQQFRG